MQNISTSLLLRIFISNSNTENSNSLYESLVSKAQNYGLNKTSVTKGVLGFGPNSVIHSYRYINVTEQLPTIIEVIDYKEKVLAYYETIRNTLESTNYNCMVTSEEIDTLINKDGLNQRI